MPGTRRPGASFVDYGFDAAGPNFVIVSKPVDPVLGTSSRSNEVLDLKGLVLPHWPLFACTDHSHIGMKFLKCGGVRHDPSELRSVDAQHLPVEAGKGLSN